MNVIETDDSEIVRAGMHFDYEAVGRDGDHLADGAFAVVAARWPSPSTKGDPAFFGDVASSAFRIASSMRSLGRCGINSSMIVSK